MAHGDDSVMATYARAAVAQAIQNPTDDTPATPYALARFDPPKLLLRYWPQLFQEAARRTFSLRGAREALDWYGALGRCDVWAPGDTINADALLSVRAARTPPRKSPMAT
jgi:hypothetical protein